MKKTFCESCHFKFNPVNRYEPSSSDYCSYECYDNAINGYSMEAR